MSSGAMNAVNAVVDFFARKGYLLKPELIEKLPEDLDKEGLLRYLEGRDVIVVDDVLLQRFIDEQEERIEKGEGVEKVERVSLEVQEKKSLEKEKEGEVEEEVREKEVVKEGSIKGGRGVRVLRSFNEKSKKLEVGDFVSYFKSRYNIMKEILQTRNGLREVISISRARGKNNERVALIGMVNEKKITKNENVILELEDLSGRINVLINKNRFELFNLSKEIVLDEVMGVVGNINKDFVFVSEVFFPDIPVIKEFKKNPKEEYAVFISDLHVGNKTFLKGDFERFLEWLKGRGEEEQREVVEKIKYLFVVGDLIEGVGIFPGQEEELEIKDYYEQYEEFVRLMKEVPKRINIILSPGNHDALRLDEPQPALGKGVLREWVEEENVFLVSNPAWVNIASGGEFPGFDVLMYHGGSFNYYADVVEGIRLKGGQQRADLIMEFLLKKRHLAPTHASVSYFAGGKDGHVIDRIPDFFVSGHVHRCSADNYKNVSLVNCSCWVPQSDYMEKQGLMPEPSRAVIVNLQTREMKILNFEKKEEEKEVKGDFSHQILSAPQKILEKTLGLRKGESKEKGEGNEGE